MNISDLIPNLQPMVEDLSQKLRFICFFILTASLIAKTGRSGTSVGQLTRPIVTNIILCGIIATLPAWFNLIRDAFWNIAVTIRQEFTGSVDGTGSSLLQLIEPPDTGTNWLDVGNSLAKAIQYALGWLIVWIGAMVQLPMMIAQFIMECLSYLFLPVAISLLAFDSTKGLAIRYIQQTLAILAWPIGFALVDLVGYSLLTSATSAVSAGAVASGLAIGFTPAKMVIGGMVALWLVLGSLATPVVMQLLFCSGIPMSSLGGQTLQIGLGFAGASRFLSPRHGEASSLASPPNGPASSGPSSTPPAPSSPPGPTGPISSNKPPSPPSPEGPPQQTPRGGVVTGAAADRISPEQAQQFADQTGTPFTQAFSDGSVVTHEPAVSRVPPVAPFVSSETLK